jgi:hypothetical protein
MILISMKFREKFQVLDFPTQINNIVWHVFLEKYLTSREHQNVALASLENFLQCMGRVNVYPVQFTPSLILYKHQSVICAPMEVILSIAALCLVCALQGQSIIIIIMTMLQIVYLAMRVNISPIMRASFYCHCTSNAWIVSQAHIMPM